jgi:hypothetical protein
MKARLTSFALALALLAALLMPTGSAVAQGTSVTNQVSDIPVTGRGPSGSRFNGLLDITQFAVQNGQIVAQGTLSGTLTNRAGTVLRQITDMVVAIPVTSLLPDPANCKILDLTLGPLDLNLLGLVVHLDTVHLEITAVPGSGILGQLLCSIADLLDANGPLGEIVNLLNRILGILQGL